MVLSTYANNIYIFERLEYFCNIKFYLSKMIPFTLFFFYCSKIF